MRHLILAALALSATSAYADFSGQALSYIPDGKVLSVSEHKREVKIQSPGGSVVEVEFKRDGRFEEASGDNAEKDIFIPKQNILSLKDAVTKLRAAGKAPVGDWSLESDFIHGWHYEFDGLEDGKKMEYVLDAINGKLIDSKVDD